MDDLSHLRRVEDIRHHIPRVAVLELEGAAPSAPCSRQVANCLNDGVIVVAHTAPTERRPPLNDYQRPGTSMAVVRSTLATPAARRVCSAASRCSASTADNP